MACKLVEVMTNCVSANSQGVAVHDFWKPYYRCGGRHALCNAHLLRDLMELYEVTGESWVAQLGDLLVDRHRAASAARDNGHDHVGPDRYGAPRRPLPRRAS